MSAFRSALVSGATGFLGSALVEHLLARGIDTFCLVRPPCADHARTLPSAVRAVAVSSFTASELKSKLAGVKADVIFNLASYGVQQADRDPAQLIEGNVGVLAGLLEATASWPLRRFIHVGSCSEYGFPERDNVPITETQTLRPTSLYGAAKAASFLFGGALASQLQIPFATMRLFGVFGPHEAPDRVVPYLIRKLRNNEPVDLTPGEQVRDFLYEDDVMEAFVATGESSALKSGEVYNVCSGRPTRVRELGEAVADALGKPHQLLHWGERPYRADEPMWLVGDNRRFRAATSWQPRVSVEEGIRRMIASSAIEKTREHQHAL
ncbi:MAG TPA: NAD(P)-dependent oxidoreductase [Terriglobales bacterium]|nr:NAD(P)-dependent oxidoreductase [Terriglobales bacterium]